MGRKNPKGGIKKSPRGDETIPMEGRNDPKEGIKKSPRGDFGFPTLDVWDFFACASLFVPLKGYLSYYLYE